MKRTPLVVLIVAVLAAMGSVRETQAFDALPDPPPGSSITTNDPSTYVQMVSENVTMSITDYEGPPVTEWYDLATDIMVGHIHASFDMVNQGTEAETFNVYFPLLNGGAGVKAIDNFNVYIDGQMAKTRTVEIGKGGWTKHFWAIWEATFTPGKIVKLDLEYDVHPQGAGDWGYFTYILETGAGWYGPIGEGTIIFRLPYEVNELNTLFSTGYSPHPDHYTVSGTDVIWRFKDLEPTERDNIHLEVFHPSSWRVVDEARTLAAANPESDVAQLAFARTLAEQISCAKGCPPSQVEAAKRAYQRALELAPDNEDVYVECAAFLRYFARFADSLPGESVPFLDHALELYPDNEQLHELRDWYYDHRDSLATLKPDATLLPTLSMGRMIPSPTPIETPGVPGKPFMTWTPGPTRTSYFHPTSTLTPILLASPTPIPIPPSAPTPPIPLWATIGALVIGGAGVGVWAYWMKIKRE